MWLNVTFQTPVYTLRSVFQMFEFFYLCNFVCKKWNNLSIDPAISQSQGGLEHGPQEIIWVEIIGSPKLSKKNCSWMRGDYYKVCTPYKPKNRAFQHFLNAITFDTKKTTKFYEKSSFFFSLKKHINSGFFKKYQMRTLQLDLFYKMAIVGFTYLFQ